jgi:hypothetical protein
MLRPAAVSVIQKLALGLSFKLLLKNTQSPTTKSAMIYKEKDVKGTF